MADIGYVRGLLGGLDASVKRSFVTIFEHILGNLRIGLPGHQQRAENFAFIQLNGTTHATANTEFSIEHGIASAPRVAFPCLDLTTVGAQMVPLKTTRAADTKRVYLSSASTSASFTIFVEQKVI